MSEITNLNSLLKDSLVLSAFSGSIINPLSENTKESSNKLPNVLDSETLTKLKNGEFEISLKEYTNLNSYNTVMNSLYGDNSTVKFPNIQNFAINSAENNLADAKSFIKQMKENGMSNETAIRTYNALQKYSIMTSVKNYNFVNAKA